MHFEVEQKFPLCDIAAIVRQLKELGALAAGTAEQIDQYFNHPARNFAQTDEALRLRSEGQKNFITYKGPKLDAATKTRREIELPLADGAAALSSFAELLAMLGFQSVATVRKTRQHFQVPWQRQTVEAAIDDVAEVGQYLELELSAGAGGIEAAKACIASLAGQLGLAKNERRSYLELLLGGRGNG
jgi:adenylate cyclase class 2